MTNNLNPQTISTATLASMTAQIRSRIPKAEDFTMAGVKPADRSRNFKRGARRLTSRATRTIL